MSYGTPPPQDPQQPYGEPSQPGPGQSTKGFFGALFDFSFEHFVTPILVKAVYILAFGVLGLLWLVYLGIGFSQSTGLGIAALIVGPIVILVYLAFIRMTLEIYLSVVRMSQDIHQRLPR